MDMGRISGGNRGGLNDVGGKGVMIDFGQELGWSWRCVYGYG